ncbi:hypothetical protein AAULR_24316 [Lacticaseibacillus rhamnosus MTCC 5462]|nr:hypothetical protein AAULR_24316 [Lacticaseibacillus rhamnosus MTCC 5462]
MTTKMSEDMLKELVARLISNANDAQKEYRKDKHNEFNSGKALAYYEMLDTIKNQLQIDDVDLKAFGLDINLEKTYL